MVVGDPRGEFITGQLDGIRGMNSLLRRHRAAWAGPLDSILEVSTQVFDRGFLAEATLAKTVRDLAPYADLPDWATLGTLTLPAETPTLLPAFLRVESLRVAPALLPMLVEAGPCQARTFEVTARIPHEMNSMLTRIDLPRVENLTLRAWRSVSARRAAWWPQVQHLTLPKSGEADFASAMLSDELMVTGDVNCLGVRFSVERTGHRTIRVRPQKSRRESLNIEVIYRLQRLVMSGPWTIEIDAPISPPRLAELSRRLGRRRRTSLTWTVVGDDDSDR